MTGNRTLLMALSVLLAGAMIAAPAAAAEVSVSNWAELNANITNAGDGMTMIITQNITFTNTITLSAAKNITLVPGGTENITLIHDMGFGTYMFQVTNGNLMMDNASNKNILIIDGREDSGALPLIGVGNKGIFTLNDGYLYNNTANGRGGGVHVMSGGTFVMNGGVIKNNTATNGSGVYMVGNARFTMNGGTIAENHATAGGGVHVHSAGSGFMMNGGTITGNTATNGGGVYLESGSISNTDSWFVMKGGVIEKNTATNGGGVDVRSETGYPGNFTLSGGSIQYNIAQSGGGIRISGNGDGIVNMTGGVIQYNYARLDGGGIAVIDSDSHVTMNDGLIQYNTAGEKGGGVHLVTGGKLNISAAANISGNNAKTGGEIYEDGNSYFSISGNAKVGPHETYLEEGSSITVLSSGESDRSSVLNITPKNTALGTVVAGLPEKTPYVGNYLDRFTLSSKVPSTVELAFSSDTTPNPVLHLGMYSPTPSPSPSPTPSPTGQSGDSSGNTDNTFRVLFETNGGSPVSPITSLSYGDVIAKPKDPTKTGFMFGGWYTDPAGQKAWNFANGITGDMTLYAAWTSGQTGTGTVAVTATTTIAATVSTATASPSAGFGNTTPTPRS